MSKKLPMEIDGVPIISKMAEMEMENALLKSKIDAYEKEAEQAKKEAEQVMKEAKIMRMLDTGLDEMVYHLGFCSDVLGDGWIPDYEDGGLAGLKKSLRESSKYVHSNSECSTCDRLINGIRH
jgi:hypothetical protein